MSAALLITGASGFVGLNLVEQALASGRTVVGLSHAPVAPATAERFRALPGRWIEVVGDVRDRSLLDSLLREHRVSSVVHMAAITASTERERVAGDEIVSVNLGGLACVIGAAARARVSRFVYVSSIAVYGGQQADGSLVDEDTPHAPQTLYAITKSSGEAITARLCAVHAVDWITARLGRVFGPHEHDSGVRDTLSQIHQVTRQALAGGTVAFERPCVKNWSYAPDVAARLLTLSVTPAHEHRTYNLGSEHAWSLADWCALLAARCPAFRHHVGTTASPGDAVHIDLGGARDAGLLSWQRYEHEFGPATSADLATAFAGTLRSLDS
jgi:nucleoside-diphosphate-sugar epimerase